LRLYGIVCEVLVRECWKAAAISPHVVTLSIQPFGLHENPDELRTNLQKEIDSVDPNKYDYILLGYGLCSRGTADLIARSIPIIIPRAHDCITLLLGSRDRYEQEFKKHPGTYYYSPGWVERKQGEARQDAAKTAKEQLMADKFKLYVEKYGEDNARYLIEQESLWITNYNRAAFIDTCMGNKDFYRQFTRNVAETHGWLYEEIPGDTRLIDLLFGGQWNEDEFLIIRPGQRTIEAVNQGIISAID
jgi:hypothetical protein